MAGFPVRSFKAVSLQGRAPFPDALLPIHILKQPRAKHAKNAKEKRSIIKGCFFARLVGASAPITDLNFFATFAPLREYCRIQV
jgi:hypothetical protein